MACESVDWVFVLLLILYFLSAVAIICLRVGYIIGVRSSAEKINQRFNLDEEQKDG